MRFVALAGAVFTLLTALLTAALTGAVEGLAGDTRFQSWTARWWPWMTVESLPASFGVFDLPDGRLQVRELHSFEVSTRLQQLDEVQIRLVFPRGLVVQDIHAVYSLGIDGYTESYVGNVADVWLGHRLTDSCSVIVHVATIQAVPSVEGLKVASPVHIQAHGKDAAGRIVPATVR